MRVCLNDFNDKSSLFFNLSEYKFIKFQINKKCKNPNFKIELVNGVKL